MEHQLSSCFSFACLIDYLPQEDLTHSLCYTFILVLTNMGFVPALASAPSLTSCLSTLIDVYAAVINYQTVCIKIIFLQFWRPEVQNQFH